MLYWNPFVFSQQQKQASSQPQECEFGNSSKHRNCSNGETSNLNSSGIATIKRSPDTRNMKYNSCWNIYQAHFSYFLLTQPAQYLQNEAISQREQLRRGGDPSQCGNKTFKPVFTSPPNPNEHHISSECLAVIWTLSSFTAVNKFVSEPYDMILSFGSKHMTSTISL